MTLRVLAIVVILALLSALSVFDALRHPVEPDELDLAARQQKVIYGAGE